MKEILRLSSKNFFCAVSYQFKDKTYLEYSVTYEDSVLDFILPYKKALFGPVITEIVFTVNYFIYLFI